MATPTKAQLELDISDLRLKLRDEGTINARKVNEIAVLLQYAEKKDIPFPQIINLLWSILDA